MKSRIQKSLAVMLTILGPALTSQASGFAEDFESGLSQWTGKSGGSHNGLIIADPLSSGRGNVLTFDDFGSGGDLFTALKISNTNSITISFDYLGLADHLSVPGDFGGFLGLAKSLNPKTEGQDIFWYAGTIDSYPSLLTTLVDDGQWHSYQFTVDGAVLGAFRLTLEDFAGSGGSRCDVYFDNICVIPTPTQVPEPSTAMLGLMSGLATLVMFRRRR
ncbi:MAG: PEP-CTERM sorting domain-containing protein [Verrucomicrobiota bacterium]